MHNKSILIKTSLVVMFGFLLTACGNPELQKCEADAGKLWNTNPKSKEDNAPYWRVIAACKKRYG